MTGRFIAVVGPSGVGKDTVMGELAASWPQYRLARRVITRPADAGGEDFEGISQAEFARRAAQGQFVLHWDAHGLRYGIPVSVTDDLGSGHDVLANLSRSALPAAVAQFAGVRVVLLTAAPNVLARRLAVRGRETPDQIAQRLAQAGKGIPDGLDVITIHNDGPLGQTVAALHAALQPDSMAR